MKKSSPKFLMLLLVFVVVQAFIFLTSSMLIKFGAAIPILYIANAFLFILSCLSLYIQTRALSNKNPNVFVRAITGGMLIKMMGCGMGVLFYYMLTPATFNKISVVVSMVFYLIYLTAEVAMMMKSNQQHA